MTADAPSQRGRKRGGRDNGEPPPERRTVATPDGGERAMPHNLDAERVVIGSMLIDNTVVAAALELLGTGDGFYSQAHRDIYGAILSVVDRREAADPMAVAHELEAKGRLEAVGGLPYLARLEASVLAPGNIAAHARVVAEKYQLRRLISTCQEIAEEALAEETPVADSLQKAEAQIFSIASSMRRGRGTPDISILARETLDEIERRAKDRHAVTGVPTGYYDLDAKTGGLQRSDLVILAARPSMGKTAFALNICQNVAGLGTRPDHGASRALVFSLEMSASQLTQRVLASITRVNLHRLRTGRLDPPTMQKLGGKAVELANSPLVLDDTPGLSILELRSRARRVAAQYPDLSLIMIDYMQLMTSGRRAESRQQEVSEISRSLKELARELNVPVLALSQLSRASEQRSGKDKRPLLSDLRESGSIEQDADVVMFVHREDYYRRKEKDGEGGPQQGGAQGPGAGGPAGKQALAPEIAEIIIGKQRNGPTGAVELIFLPDLASFMSMSRQPGAGAPRP